MSVKSLEKHTIKGKSDVVRLRRLGNHEVELITSTYKEELRQELFKAVNGLGYTTDAEITDRHNIVCRLIPTVKKNFGKLIEKIVRLLIRCIEGYTESAITQPAPKQASHLPSPKKHGKRYYKRHKKDPYHNIKPNYKVVAARI